MQRQEPFRHHEPDGKCVGFDFLQRMARLEIDRHPPQYAVLIVKAWLMVKAATPKLMGGSEPLNGKRSLGRHQNAARRDAEISPQKPSSGRSIKGTSS